MSRNEFKVPHRKMLVNLEGVETVKKFVAITAKYDFDIDLIPEASHYVIDAKSIMGIYSLDLSKPVYVYTADLSKNYEQLFNEIKEAGMSAE